MKLNFDSDYFPPVCFVASTASRLLKNLSCISSPLLRKVSCLATGIFSFYHIFVATKALCFQSYPTTDSCADVFQRLSTIFLLIYAVFAFFHVIFCSVFFSISTLLQFFYCLSVLFLVAGYSFHIDPFVQFFDANNRYLYLLKQIFYFFILLSSLTVWAS